ncbi:predicted protein [Naegleria gruberi]|uniref:Predicted protein n=1 Tax=Naegleria gruberi TaxID=5762 RepID=D2VIE6_NAEGR|nr:uncharacterized protein NAEGRDRAFT_68657 [Naegleria gruberi]EFC43252.1 predicted protein [Naegleria gruberi]|eukprot:XP_002675996.1 predicted protein [Naegleria gruberi strain NEG-M]
MSSSTKQFANCCCCKKRGNRFVPNNVTITNKTGTRLCDSHYQKLRRFIIGKIVEEDFKVEYSAANGFSQPIGMGKCKHVDTRSCANCKSGNTVCKGVAVEKVWNLLNHDGKVFDNHNEVGIVSFNDDGVFVFKSLECENIKLNRNGVCTDCHQLYEKLRHLKYKKTNNSDENLLL